VSHPQPSAGSNLADRTTRVRWRPSTLAALVAASVAMPAGGGDALAGAQTVARFTPITDAMLVRPDPADWLNWRRTLDGWGYSPLDQINTRNVHQLQLAWSWALHDGESQPTPLVANGTMYIPIPGGGAQALDAATGDFIWEYRPEATGATRPTGPMRSLALYDDKVFVATGDARLMALDARTGAIAWSRQVADPKAGYRYTSGPIVARGAIVAGITGCQRYKNDTCFISAHDGRTGKELWRTSTVARPGEPGGDTWGDLPLMFRAGSDAWIPGSYDPGTNLIYWGTAQAKPWARFARGTDGDALYTNSTLALDATTGRIVWYYQHIPGESHDMDETFERILVDMPGRSSVFSMGKLGILWELDRKTGRFLSARDLGYQNLIDVDPKTGKATYRPNTIPQAGVELSFCPSRSGFKSLRAMAYHPETEAFYIPLNLSCETGTFTDVTHVEGGGGNGAGRRKNRRHPESPDGIGEFLAMSARTGAILWRNRTPAQPNTAALTTAGGLVLVGDWDRHLFAYDVTTGKTLYQTRLSTSVQGFPITYAVDGRQFLAVPAGTGGGQWITTIPADTLPDRQPPPAGNVLFVFALPR
jgi:alcohol dehydrogenase (cytochrome c)